MQIHRFYCDPISQPRTVITGPEAHHAASVMRLKKDHIVELFDGRGALAKARIEQIRSKQLVCQIENIQTAEKPAGPRIIVAASVPKADRFDLLIAKCTELGVDAIAPVIFDRSIKQPKNPKIIDRWNNIAVAAAKQCKRLHLPTIDFPLPLTDAIERLTADYPTARILLGSFADNAKPLIQTRLDQDPVIAFIGPEGGLTDREQNFLAQIGALPVRITDTILRAETAAIALASILTAMRDALSHKKSL